MGETTKAYEFGQNLLEAHPAMLGVKDERLTSLDWFVYVTECLRMKQSCFFPVFTSPSDGQNFDTIWVSCFIKNKDVKMCLKELNQRDFCKSWVIV
jgi:hypothetical protein